MYWTDFAEISVALLTRATKNFKELLNVTNIFPKLLSDSCAAIILKIRHFPSLLRNGNCVISAGFSMYITNWHTSYCL